MSFGRLTSLAERLGSRRSLELPSDIETPRQKQGDDFVLVGGSLPDSEGNQENTGSEDDQNSLKSPEPVSLHLKVPSEGDSSSQGKAVHLNLDINDETLLPSWKDRSPASDDESMAHDADTTAATDCTDYSGLGESLPEKDKSLTDVLAEVNQRHEWAMEAVIRGWEAEKADLLSKLEKTTEAHDYLEAELKHREDNFAGLLDSMLDQKLDQMLQLLQESGVSPQTPTSTRASFSSPSGSSPSQQPTVRKATKVVNDLGSIMEAMKNQHAELQSAILQLLPEDLDEEDRQRITSCLDGQRLNRKRRLNPVKASLRRVGDAFNGSKTYAREKVPRLVRASSSVAGRTIRVPARFTRRVARQVTSYCHSKGLRNEHLTAFAGILTGILVSSLIVKSAGRKDKQVAAKEEAVIEPQSKPEVLEFTKEDAEECKEGAETCGECMHIIFSGNGIYKRTTYDSSPSLMFAWPKIVLDYK